MEKNEKKNHFFFVCSTTFVKRKIQNKHPLMILLIDPNWYIICQHCDRQTHKHENSKGKLKDKYIKFSNC